MNYYEKYSRHIRVCKASFKVYKGGVDYRYLLVYIKYLWKLSQGTGDLLLH